MEVGDWINLFAAIFLLGAIFVSLYIGLKSINQTKNIQERRYRRELLKEIAQWATDVIAVWQSIDVENECRIRENIDENLFSTWRDISARSENIGAIADKYFGKDLYSLVIESDSIILDISEIIRGCRKGEITLDFPREFPKDALAFDINASIVREAEDGRKIIDSKELVHEELGKLYELTCKLLEGIRQIEIKELGS